MNTEVSRKNNGSIWISIVIILFLALLITDFVRVRMEKNKLSKVDALVESMISAGMNEDVITRYINKDIDKNFIELKLDYGKYTVTLSRNIKLYTPGINLFIDNPYKVEVVTQKDEQLFNALDGA